MPYYKDSAFVFFMCKFKIAQNSIYIVSVILAKHQMKQNIGF